MQKPNPVDGRYIWELWGEKTKNKTGSQEHHQQAPQSRGEDITSHHLNKVWESRKIKAIPQGASQIQR